MSSSISSPQLNKHSYAHAIQQNISSPAATPWKSLKNKKQRLVFLIQSTEQFMGCCIHRGIRGAAFLTSQDFCPLWLKMAQSVWSQAYKDILLMYIMLAYTM